MSCALGICIFHFVPKDDQSGKTVVMSVEMSYIVGATIDELFGVIVIIVIGHTVCRPVPN